MKPWLVLYLGVIIVQMINSQECTREFQTRFHGSSKLSASRTVRQNQLFAARSPHSLHLQHAWTVLSDGMIKMAPFTIANGMRRMIIANGMVMKMN
jgi:hypothetical protein